MTQEIARQKLLKDKKRFPTGRYAGLLFTEEDLRFATSEQVADYRAKKMACNNLLEIGAGVGFQTIAFAKSCKHVLAVEIDPRKTDFLKKNLEIMGIKNVEVLQGDCLSADIVAHIQNIIPHPDIIFLDPERPPAEAERSLATIKPDIPIFIKIYEPLSKHIGIELPPQIKNIPLEGEREYLSLKGHIERLTVYLHKKTTTVLVDMASGRKIENRRQEEKTVIAKKSLPYVYKISDAVTRLGLTKEVCRPPLCMLDVKEHIMTSSTLQKSPFFEAYLFMETASDENQLLLHLKKAYGAKVVLRFSLPPEEAGRKTRIYTAQLKRGTGTIVVLRTSTGVFLTAKEIPV